MKLKTWFKLCAKYKSALWLKEINIVRKKRGEYQEAATRGVL